MRFLKSRATVKGDCIFFIYSTQILKNVSPQNFALHQIQECRSSSVWSRLAPPNPQGVLSAVEKVTEKGPGTVDCINNGSSICDVTRWFVDCCFEASSLDFGQRHLVFLEPKVTIFGKGDDTELALC